MHAKKALSVAVHNHYKRMQNHKNVNAKKAEQELQKSIGTLKTPLESDLQNFFEKVKKPRKLTILIS